MVVAGIGAAAECAGLLSCVAVGGLSRFYLKPYIKHTILIKLREREVNLLS